MKNFKVKPKTILYLHGFKSFPGDSIHKFFEESFTGARVVCPYLDYTKPEETLKIMRINPDLVIGFSMGGFWASLFPGKAEKLFINPAFLFPYILLGILRNIWRLPGNISFKTPRFHLPYIITQEIKLKYKAFYDGKS